MTRDDSQAGGEFSGKDGFETPQQPTHAVPHHYVNSAAFAMTLTEIDVTLTFANKPVVMLAVPPSVAKTLAKGLLELIERYERDLDVKVFGLDELDQRFEAKRTSKS